MYNLIAGTSCLQKKLKPDAVPSVFKWTNKNKLSIAESRRSRAEKRQQSKNVKEEELQPLLCVGAECEVSTIDFSVAEEEHEHNSMPKYIDQFSQCDRLTFCVEKFELDIAAIHFYTGLETYNRLLIVFNSLGSAVNHLIYRGGRQIDVLSPINQFFLTLVKLRCNKTNFELSRLFEISETSVENIFITWINFMYRQWSELAMWPSRDLVSYYMPVDFKHRFPKTRVIFDATECPIKKPKTPRAQQATFSTYKNRNTVKVLVGSTPGGLISYISPAYGGSTTDRQIVERSNISSICDPGDSLMADKGFNVQDLFQHANVSVNIPTFFRKRNRMDGKTVLHDRKIASKRVHIERIIGLAKTYKILTQPLSSSYVLLATEIISVCFMLCNFRKSIVPTTA
jgi:hypothetical protein